MLIDNKKKKKTFLAISPSKYICEKEDFFWIIFSFNLFGGVDFDANYHLSLS